MGKKKYVIGIGILLIGSLIYLFYIAQKDRLPVVEENDVESLTMGGFIMVNMRREILM